MDVSLGPTTTWDDQGLWFALVFNSIACTALVCLSLFFIRSPILWLRRRYRSNHTVLLQLSPLSTSRDDNADSPETAAERKAPGVGSSSLSDSRMTRVGRALRYPSTLTAFPSWRCWLSIEEKLEHMENVFPSAVARFPFTDGAINGADGDASRFEDIYRGDEPYVEVQATCSSEAPQQRSPQEQRQETTGDEAVSPTPREVKKVMKERETLCKLQRTPDEEDIKKLTRVPLDPHISLYISFLKLFTTIFLAGAVFNIWISVISGTDDYVEQYTVSRDIHRCHRQDDNETGCIEKNPFCQYIIDTGCFPIPLRGLYDLSVQNITPESWRLWLVALFDMAFGVLYILSVLYFLRHVDKYISTVMRAQMEGALGHRVVLVRSLKDSWTTDTVFQEKFLDESAYFGSPNQKGTGNPPKADNEAINATFSPILNPCSSNPQNSDDDDDDGSGSGVYHHLDCMGLGCLFSIVSCHYYKTTRKDAVFTRYGKVKQLLFPRKAPEGMYKYINATEKAMEALQEAVADVNKYRLQQEQEGNAHHSHHQPKALMMRAPFPACCTKVPRVEYWKRALITNATQLNTCITAIAIGDLKGYAFVIFADALSAYEFVNLFEARNRGSSHARATIAGPPEGIIQINVTTDRYTGWIRTLLALGAYMLLILFWSVPVGFLSSLDNIARIPGLGGPLYEFYLSTPDGLRGVITAFFPVVMLFLLNALLPFIIKCLVIFMGAVNEEELNGGILHLQFVFMLLTGVVFQAALQGGLFQLADIIAEPTTAAIVNLFVALVSPQGGYWYANVITAAFVSTWLAFIDPVTVFLVFCRRRLVSVQHAYDRLFCPRGFNWAALYSSDLTVLAMGLLFHMTVPLLAVFVGIYFLLRYATQRGLLMDNHRPREHPRRHGGAAGLAATAQVMRTAASLHTVGGMGGVLFMSLRRHVGGVVICSITLAASILLLLYVFVVSRRWVASLANARRLLTREEESVGVGQYGATATDTARNGGRGKMGRGTAGRRVTGVEGEGHMRERQYCCDNDSNKGREVVETMAHSEKNGNKREDENGEKEEDMLLTGNTNDNRRNINSYTRNLLPRRSHIGSMYQPKHQQLEHIGIDGEIRRIEETVYLVERYWDVPFHYLSDDVNYTRTTLPVPSLSGAPPPPAAAAAAAAPEHPLGDDVREGSMG